MPASVAGIAVASQARAAAVSVSSITPTRKARSSTSAAARSAVSSITTSETALAMRVAGLPSGARSATTATASGPAAAGLQETWSRASVTVPYPWTVNPSPAPGRSAGRR